MRTADISGTQRKVVDHHVRPARLSQGTEGIPLRGGKTLAFTVSRSWSAPAGIYDEGFFLIDPESREVLFEGPSVERSVQGLQSMTEFVETIDTPVALTPGKYAVVFALGGIMGGEFPVEAFEVTDTA